MYTVFCSHHLEGMLLSVNQAMAKRAGHERAEEMAGRNVREYLDSKVEHLFPAYIQKVVEKGRAQGLVEVRTRTREPGALEFNSTLPREGLDGPTVRTVSRDVTERLRADGRIVS